MTLATPNPLRLEFHCTLVTHFPHLPNRGRIQWITCLVQNHGRPRLSMQYRVDIDTMVPVAFDRIIFDILE